MQMCQYMAQGPANITSAKAVRVKMNPYLRHTMFLVVNHQKINIKR